MRRVVGRTYWMKYSSKGHKDRNRHKKRMKRSGQAQLVSVKIIVEYSPPEILQPRESVRRWEKAGMISVRLLVKIRLHRWPAVARTLSLVYAGHCGRPQLETSRYQWRSCGITSGCAGAVRVLSGRNTSHQIKSLIHPTQVVTSCLMSWWVSWCFKPSQPQRITSGLRETFKKRYNIIVERTNKAEIRPEEQSENAASCWENLWNEIQLEGSYRQ